MHRTRSLSRTTILRARRQIHAKARERLFSLHRGFRWHDERGLDREIAFPLALLVAQTGSRRVCAVICAALTCASLSAGMAAYHETWALVGAWVGLSLVLVGRVAEVKDSKSTSRAGILNAFPALRLMY